VQKKRSLSHRCRCYTLGVCTLIVTATLMISLIGDGFDATVQDGRPIDGMLSVPNTLGPLGAFLAGTLSLFFGDAAHLLYSVTFIWMLMLFCLQPLDRPATRLAGLTLLTGAAAGLAQMDFASGWSNNAAGGLVGAFVTDRLLMPWFGFAGSQVIGMMTAVIGLLLCTDFLFIHLLVYAGRAVAVLGRVLLYLAAACTGMGGHYRRWRTGRRIRRARARVAPRPADESPLDAPPEAGEMAPSGAAAQDTRSPWSGEPVIKGAGVPVPSTPAPAVRKRPAPPYPETAPLPFDLPPDEAAPAPAPAPATGSAAALFDLGDGEDEDDDPLSTAAFGPAVPAFPEPAAMPAPAVPSVQEPARAVVIHTPASAQETRTLRNAPVPAPAAPARGLRRKTGDQGDLPEGYVYPKKYTAPPLELFRPPEHVVIPNLEQKLRRSAAVLEETLAEFGIEAKVTDITRGPTVTRFELEPAPGIKVSKFLALTDNIALTLEAKGVRVEAPIPGKARVGIEVSNLERDPVVLRELLESAGFRRGKGALNLALGKGISGDVCIADLARMPHLLVAGATGAGKTVCVKALLASLLLQHTPEQLQLILIDPKMVELSIFDDIPHLITPVVTDVKKASAALCWLVNEMEERYQLFRDLQFRNIEVYNESVENGEVEIVNAGDGPSSVSVVRRLPYIVCVIDELADLMMLARAEVEDSIARLAQKARAVGIHLIIATQRPSVDVLTGVIKANFPSRISFQVSSRVDSRCILDEIGAERLVGMGDMLYLPAGQGKPDRIQGAFVSDDEMDALVAWLKRQAPPQYRDEVENFGKTKEYLEKLADEDDPEYDNAVDVVLQSGQASISMLQRRLRLGYNRAARLIDMMEIRGIVGPHMGSKAREILVDQKQSSRDEVA